MGEVVQLPRPAAERPVYGLADGLKRLQDEDLALPAKIAYLLIDSYPEAWFSVQWLADRLGCALSTARAVLADLEGKGWIRRSARFKERAQTSNGFIITRRPALSRPEEVIHTPPAEELAGPPTGSPAPKQHSGMLADLKATTAVENQNADEPDPNTELEHLRQALDAARRGEPIHEGRATPPLHAGPGLRKADGALIRPETLIAISNAFGSDQTAALQQAFASARWRVPHVAEAGCQLLLKRRLKTSIKSPRNYVETLYAEAVAMAQRIDLEVPSIGVRPPPKSPNAAESSLGELFKRKDWLHGRIRELEQTSDASGCDHLDEVFRMREQLRDVCRFIVKKTAESEAHREAG